MTAAVASFQQDRFFGTDLTNVGGFKTVLPRKSKAHQVPSTPKATPVKKKSESPRNSPNTPRRRLPKGQSTPATPSSVETVKAPSIKYSRDVLLQLRANATTDSTFVSSLNMPRNEKADDEQSGSSDDANSKSTPKQKEREIDEHRLAQRQKQIEYGKNTVGYIKFAEQVPREQRTVSHPRTPEKNQKCSKRSWDGQVRKWRRQLHFYDPNADPKDLDSSSDDTSDDAVNVSQSIGCSTPSRSSSSSSSSSSPLQQLCSPLQAILAVSNGSPQRAEPGDAI